MTNPLTCPYCGSTEFVVGKENKTYGGISKSGNFTGQPICHDICKNCGTIVRSFVENPSKLV